MELDKRLKEKKNTHDYSQNFPIASSDHYHY